MDTYFIPAQEVCPQFTRMGIPESAQIVSGIPVRQVFYEKADRQQTRQQLELPQDGVVAVVMCGSMGCGPIKKIALETLSQMPDNGVMVAVCGRNEKLREELSQVTDPRLRVLGFIHNFPEYLDAADLIITKPGGLSSTEAANKHVPMVFINTVGGCESHNFDLFLRKGYAVGSEDPEEVVRIAIRMVWDEESRQRLRQNLARDFTVNTNRVICDHIVTAAQNYRKSM